MAPSKEDHLADLFGNVLRITGSAEEGKSSVNQFIPPARFHQHLLDSKKCTEALSPYEGGRGKLSRSWLQATS